MYRNIGCGNKEAEIARREWDEKVERWIGNGARQALQGGDNETARDHMLDCVDAYRREWFAWVEAAERMEAAENAIPGGGRV